MPLPFTLDSGPAPRAAIGLIALQTDEVLEAELPLLFPEPDVALHVSRIPFDPDVTPETLAAMAAELPRAAALLPTGRGLDAVGYACTSGATVIGPERVAAAIRESHPRAAATDPISAVIDALRTLGARRLAFLTPYLPAVSGTMRARLEAAGFEIAAFGSFEEQTDALVARIAPASVLEAARELGAAQEVDAVFASCTNLRSFGIVEAAEAALGKPFVSSNLALGWRLRGLAGLETRGAGPGRLFARYAAAASGPGGHPEGETVGAEREERDRHLHQEIAKREADPERRGGADAHQRRGRDRPALDRPD
jgi:maleate isomerase